MSAVVLRQTLRAYGAIMATRLREAVQYRAAAVAGMVTQLFWGLIRVMIMEAFYASSSAVQPMTFPEMRDYLWLTQSLLLLTPWRIDADLRAMISSGNVAFELAKPIDLYFSWFSRLLGSRAAMLGLRLPLIYGAAMLLFGLRAPASVGALLAFAVSILCALLLSTSIVTLMTISLMWTVSGSGITRLLAALSTVLSGSIIALPMFPDWSQAVLNALPFRGLMDIPFRIYMGHIPLSQAPQEIAFQLAWVAAMVLFGRLLLARGKHRMVVQGG